MHDPITTLVITLFAAPGVALMLAGAILLAAVALVVLSSIRQYRPLLGALRDRWNRLSGLGFSNQRALTPAQFPEVDAVFASNDIPELALGWRDYRSLLTVTDAGIATSIRAAEAFDRLDEPARSLEWWANIFVAVGLVVTFLGIVAALSEATATIGQGGSGAGMETALMGLLAIAATKFWTSIAGVTASIILRVVARLRRQSIDAAAGQLFVLLDSTVIFMPPEKALLEQLQSLKRIETALARPATTGEA